MAEKIQLVAKLTDIEDLVSFMPLYQEGSVLALYLEMSEEVQQCINKIEVRLKEAFMEGEFMSYTWLEKIRWPGEQVDIYANETRRLAGGLVGYTREGLEQTVRLWFMIYFPDHILVA